jgi:predicted RNase H-like HicB family nuclease
MNIKIVVHEAEEGGFWGEAPALPGCASQGETVDEVVANLREAIEGWLSADVPEPEPGSATRVLDLAL